jgi:nucleotide-binding universal stress UspA family protein
MRDRVVPMTGSILCGVDDSVASRRAVRVARELAALLDRRVVYVQVVPPGTAQETVDGVAERLQQLAADAEADRVDLWMVDVGHPADRLVAASEDEKASLLVVGSHGPRSSLLGSISADVSRRAACPVVVVPPDVDAIADAAPAAGDVHLEWTR